MFLLRLIDGRAHRGLTAGEKHPNQAGRSAPSTRKMVGPFRGNDFPLDGPPTDVPCQSQAAISGAARNGEGEGRTLRSFDAMPPAHRGRVAMHATGNLARKAMGSPQVRYGKQVYD